MEFIAEIYKIQIDGGRYILHEHPAGASSWKLKAIVDIKSMEDVEEVVTDQCMIGLTTWARGKRESRSNEEDDIYDKCRVRCR